MNIKKHINRIISILLILGISNNSLGLESSKKMIGKWEINLDKTIDAYKKLRKKNNLSKTTDEDMEKIRDSYKGVIFEFATNKIKMTWPPKTFNKEYEIVSTEDHILTIKYYSKGDRKHFDLIKIKSIDKDTIAILSEKRPAFILKRLKK